MLVNGSRSIIGLFNAWFTHTTFTHACVARAFTCVVGAIGYYSFFVHVRLHVLINCSLSISCRFLFQCD